MFQYVFDRATSRSGGTRLFRKLRRILVRCGDPLVHYEVDGRRLTLNMSHQMPLYRSMFPMYSENLGRLAAAVRRRHGALRMVDVGANVGDSLALVRPQSQDEFLLVEGDAHYFNLLSKNTRHDRSVRCVLALLSDRVHESAGVLVSKDGTAQIMAAPVPDRTASSNCKTLDQVVGEHPLSSAVNLLKTDVDGYDSKVLRGALSLIRQDRPTVFFEHDPRMLAAAGDDDVEMFGTLGRLGYSTFIMYDNFGFLKETVAASDATRLQELMSSAKKRNDYYYDVCAIHDDERMFRDQFVEEERQFFARQTSST